MVRIGILGYGGKIGSYLVKNLYSEFTLRLGQRHLTPIARTEKVEFMEVDIFDSSNLDKFVTGLDILVNCAGPSYLIKGTVAQTAARKGVAYVDAFGGKMVEDVLQVMAGTFVISAGSFPGFSGSLPLYLAEKYFDRVESFHLLSNNHEASSYSAAYDLVLSSLNNFGKGGTYYFDGEIATTLANQDRQTDWFGFEKNSYYYDYMNDETLQVAKQLEVKEAHWLNVYAGEEQSNVIKEITLEYLKKGDQQKIDGLIAKAVQASQVEQSWYRIACEMVGFKAGQRKRAYLFLEFPDSYILGSEMIRQVIMQLCKRKQETGIIWSFAYVNPGELMHNLLAEGITRTIHFQYEDVFETEEGEL